MRIFDIKQKEVINVCDCKRLGFVGDIDVDICCGSIIAIIVPGPAHICGFLGRDTEYVIPYGCISQIGEDIILVNINAEECRRKCKF